MSEFRSFFGKVLHAIYSRPLNTLKKCYKETLENVRGNIGDAFIWVAVDETMDSVGLFIANLVAGKLDIEVLSNLHLISSKILHHTNHPTVARFGNGGLPVLWHTGIHEQKVLILCSDAVVRMLKAATVLKVFDTNLINFTRLAHGL
jgi:hypothetical protein